MDITLITITSGIIIFSFIWLFMLKTKAGKELQLSLLFVIIFLIIRLVLHGMGSNTPKLYLYLHVTSLLILSLAIIRMFITVFIRYFLQTKQKIYIPKILQDLIQIGAFIIIAVIILREHLKLDTSILVTSSVLSIVIGLALQDTLGNFFSGLALQMQRPFEVGDWIMYSDKLGQVIEIDWRAIRICTLDQDVVIIPNSEISKSCFINYSKPTKLHRIVIPMGVSYKAPPNLVKDIISKILDEEPEVLSHPTPSIMLVKYNDFSIDYEIRVYTETFYRFKEITNNIYTKIWYHFKRYDVNIPFPIRDVYLHEVKPENEAQKIQRIVNVLKYVDFLNPLPGHELEKLAQGINVQKYAAGEVVIKQGEPGDSFYIINEGEVDISIIDEAGNETSLTKLSPPAFFGELSLLTGSPRNATVVAHSDSEFITINSDTFKSVIMSQPDLVNIISNIITSRQIELEESLKNKSSEELAHEIEVKSSNLLAKMKRFFGF